MLRSRAKSLLLESGLINNKIKNNSPTDIFIERLSKEGGSYFWQTILT